MRRILLVISFLVSFVSVLHSQVGQKLRAGYRTTRQNAPLAFVNIVYTSGGQGIVSNIDGEFSISSPDRIEFLKFSYLGYQEKLIPKKDIKPGKMLQVRLDEKTYDIEEVQILPGINPAHRIIDLVLENRDRNNPVKMQSFAYTSYSKMYFTLDLDSMYADAPDSEKREAVTDSSQASGESNQSGEDQGQASGESHPANSGNRPASGDSAVFIMEAGGSGRN